MLTLLKGGHVYSPSDCGVSDVLIAGTRIAKVDTKIDMPSIGKLLKVIDVSGKILVPGFIDQHVHILGGGGPSSRIPELQQTALNTNGITTIVGLLGLDTVSKTLDTLLMKAKSLEIDGTNTFIYAGGFDFPPNTITGNLKRDLAIIDKVIGVKIALGEELGAQPSSQSLAQIFSDTVAGAKLGQKPGIIHIHIGDCLGRDPFSIIANAMDESGVSGKHIVLTHINWNMDILKRAVAFADKGTFLNLDSIFRPKYGANDAVLASNAITILLNAGIPLERVTMTTDANSVITPSFYATGLETLWIAIKEIYESGTLDLSAALNLVTRNPANILNLSHTKGKIEEQADADIQILTPDLNLFALTSKGKFLIEQGKSVKHNLVER
jgi:beta-aspartyl-dipeptidase (metallo-type)